MRHSLKHVDSILSHDSSMDTYNVAIGYMITSSRIWMLFVRVGPGQKRGSLVTTMETQRWSRQWSIHRDHPYTTIRQVNPLMTPAQQGIEFVNVFNLMTIYEDRCRMCHKNVASMSEQTYYNFIKDREQKVFNEYYRFRNSQDKLYILRALQSDKDLHYKVDTNGNLEYFRSDGTATSFYVIP